MIVTRGEHAYIPISHVCQMLGRNGQEHKVAAEFQFTEPVKVSVDQLEPQPLCLVEDAFVAIMFSTREPAMIVTLWHDHPEIQARWKLRDLLEANAFVATQPATPIIKQRLASVNQLTSSAVSRKRKAPEAKRPLSRHASVVLFALDAGVQVTYKEGQFSFPLA